MLCVVKEMHSHTMYRAVRVMRSRVQLSDVGAKWVSQCFVLVRLKKFRVLYCVGEVGRVKFSVVLHRRSEVKYFDVWCGNALVG